MCCYLSENLDFQYFLTGKINQDNLEKFFGTIRQAAGSNEHPNSPTFLQLYKLLSVYSTLKPPKFGNCTVSDQHSPKILISLNDLKTAYGQKSEGELSEYRQQVQVKLNDILEHSE
ncbi:uncharacterized protein LOC124295363 [Neodiprion lecontei]|uniref:Uncharacterized protein LOC124295363 n=1 Tax=Neodiprion lecontei TaxID=441921 RepID=A0ABM3GL79_NEOLC|nr:uncharacterized protein LOC124295363 [Neodiprion lecontei]